MKIYQIEVESNELYGHRYRFKSLYNDCVGIWRFKEEEAKKDGEDHQRIINATFNFNLINWFDWE